MTIAKPRIASFRLSAAAGEGVAAGVPGRPALFLDAQQLVVLRHAIAAAQRTGLDLGRRRRHPMSAMVVSSVSPERCETMAAYFAWSAMAMARGFRSACRSG